MEYVQATPQLLKLQHNDRSKTRPDVPNLVGSFSKSLYISVVTDTWRPDINGVALTSGKMMDGLVNLGARIQLVQPVIANPSDEPEYEVLTVAGFRLPFYREVSLGVSSRKLLRRQWSHKRPDLVIIITEGLLGRSAMVNAQRLEIPVISEYHTNFQQYTRHYGFGFLESLINSYLRRFHNRAQMTLVPTDDIRQKLEKKGYRTLLTVARGIDTDLFNPNRRCEKLRRSWGLEPDQLAVIYVGRIAPEKNIDLAVSAFRRLQKINTRARFILVGDGPYRSQLESEHQDFIFCGMQRDEALAAHYASADLYLFPSITETFGNVLLEAMASGLPSVCFDYAAARRHARNRVNARSVILNNNKEFISAAVELASNRTLCRMIGNNARMSIMEYSWESVYRSYAGIINSVLKQREKP